MRAFHPCLLSVVLLAGCGNDPDRSNPLADLVQSPAEASAVASDPNAMARAGLSQVGGPLMLAVLEDRGAVALLVPYGQNGAVTTWTTAEFQTVSLLGGRVVATRGLGDDLMSRTPLAPFGTMRSTMRLNTLNAANEAVSLELECRVQTGDTMPIALASGQTLRATGYAEKCTGPEGTVQNDFWMVGGVMRQTRQWLGPEAGHLTLQVLRP